MRPMLWLEFLLRQPGSTYADGNTHIVDALVFASVWGHDEIFGEERHIKAYFFLYLLFVIWWSAKLNDALRNHRDYISMPGVDMETTLVSLATLFTVNSENCPSITVLDELSKPHPTAILSLAFVVTWAARCACALCGSQVANRPWTSMTTIQCRRSFESAQHSLRGAPIALSGIPMSLYDKPRISLHYRKTFCSSRLVATLASYPSPDARATRFGFCKGVQLLWSFAKAETGHHRLLGGAYVHGLMMGEYRTQPRGDLERISIV